MVNLKRYLCRISPGRGSKPVLSRDFFLRADHKMMLKNRIKDLKIIYSVEYQSKKKSEQQDII